MTPLESYLAGRNKTAGPMASLASPIKSPTLTPLAAPKPPVAPSIGKFQTQAAPMVGANPVLPTKNQFQTEASPTVGANPVTPAKNQFQTEAAPIVGSPQVPKALPAQPSAPIAAPPNPGLDPNMLAQFRKVHGSTFNQMSPMDRWKMQELQAGNTKAQTADYRRRTPGLLASR